MVGSGDDATQTLRAFGFDLVGPAALLLAGTTRSVPEDAVTLRLVAGGEVPTGVRVVWSTVFGDGQAVTAAETAGGGHRLDYGSAASFWVAPGGRAIEMAADHPRDVSVLRFLLDTVLWWTALARGRFLLHASCVEIDGGVLAILGGTGAGKTTLATELVLRGARLFSDDLLCFSDGAIAHPGPPFMNVPLQRLSRTALGSDLAQFTSTDGQQEAWMAANQRSAGDLPVRALIRLDRVGGDGPRIVTDELSPLDLFPYAWDIPGAPGREGPRFAALADLVDAARTLQLTADPTTTPAELAAALEGAL